MVSHLGIEEAGLGATASELARKSYGFSPQSKFVGMGGLGLTASELSRKAAGFVPQSKFVGMGELFSHRIYAPFSPQPNYEEGKFVGLGFGPEDNWGRGWGAQVPAAAPAAAPAATGPSTAAAIATGATNFVQQYLLAQEATKQAKAAGKTGGGVTTIMQGVGIGTVGAIVGGVVVVGLLAYALTRK